MTIIQDAQMLKGQPVAATIGFFDGVHLGHRFLINELKETARKQNLPTAVITFPEHPRTVLHTDYQPRLLNSFDEKLNQLSTTGIDYCLVLPFTMQLSRLSAQSFICDILHQKLNVKTLLIGYDHRFGHNRSDDFNQYVEYGKACNIEVLQAPAFHESKANISSSEIRKLLTVGNVEKAKELLSYSYQLKGTIIPGQQIGRTIGFPTANIRVDEPFKVIPGTGVYAVWVVIENKKYKGMLYIGNRPTINADCDISMEVNILDFSGDVYNRKIEVLFEHYVRDNIKFPSLEELKQQLIKDRDNISSLLTNPS
ncbi:riboflavin biosynthesis protein RibF [Parabacteroides pacaensis]|uniref:riboflavin biosynthesis protein RibF n=1 Tax=Parabacteroides pacaensis TaxID=2086575 RepID=UPI000D0EF026|nr:riboflavin biosynthesis protein RibF [Parabacteroides pacaensis]